MKYLYMCIFLLGIIPSCTEKQKDHIVEAVDSALDVADDTFFDGTDNDSVVSV